MSERTYRSVADPARLGAAERDPVTGRRTAERSDKGEHGPGGRGRRRPLVVAAVVAVLLLLVGGAALAVGGGSDEEDAREPTTTTSTSGAGEDPSPDEGGAGEGASSRAAALDGTYDVTAQDVEAFSYAVNSGTGGPLDVGGSSDGIVMVFCSGSSCVVDALGGLFPSFRGELDGSTITGEVRRPFGSDPACAGQEQVDSVELTISDDGAVSGEHVRDVVPGEVACGDGSFQSGTRYVSRLTGERE